MIPLWRELLTFSINFTEKPFGVERTYWIGFDVLASFSRCRWLKSSDIAGMPTEKKPNRFWQRRMEMREGPGSNFSIPAMLSNPARSLPLVNTLTASPRSKAFIIYWAAKYQCKKKKNFQKRLERGPQSKMQLFDAKAHHSAIREGAFVFSERVMKSLQHKQGERTRATWTVHTSLVVQFVRRTLEFNKKNNLKKRLPGRLLLSCWQLRWWDLQGKIRGYTFGDHSGQKMNHFE